MKLSEELEIYNLSTTSDGRTPQDSRPYQHKIPTVHGSTHFVGNFPYLGS